MKRNFVALAVAALLAGTVATSALPAGHGRAPGRYLGGRFGQPLIGSAPMTSPIYNPSTPYTAPQSPEVGISPASPGSLFHECVTSRCGGRLATSLAATVASMIAGPSTARASLIAFFSSSGLRAAKREPPHECSEIWIGMRCICYRHSPVRSSHPGLALGTFATGTESFMIAALLPGLAKDLSVTLTAAGQLVTVFALTYAVSSPVLSALTVVSAAWCIRPPISMSAFALANFFASTANAIFLRTTCRADLARRGCRPLRTECKCARRRDREH